MQRTISSPAPALPPLSWLIRVDPCSSVVAFPGRRKPKADTPINSSVQFPAKNRTKNTRVTRAYFHDSKGAHKKLDVNNHCDHNELVMARTPHRGDGLGADFPLRLFGRRRRSWVPSPGLL